MRKENYLIAMLNKGILKLSLPLPFLGTRGSGTLWATTGRQYLTKSLEWSVHFCVLNHMFSDKVGAVFKGAGRWKAGVGTLARLSCHRRLQLAGKARRR